MASNHHERPSKARPSARRKVSRKTPAPDEARATKPLFVNLPIDVHEKIHACAKADTGSTVTRWLTLLIRSLPKPRAARAARASRST